MSAYKKNGKWYFKGKMKDEYGVFKDYNRLAKHSRLKKEAEKEEELFISKHTGIASKNTKADLTFEELSELYFNSVKGRIKTSTITTDRAVLRGCDFIMDKKIKLIKDESIKIFFSKMDNQDLSVNYINKFYDTINKIFKYGIKNKYIFENPMENVDRVKRVDELKEEMKFYTYDEYCWVKKASNLLDPYDVIINLLYLHGCRKGEAFALKWDDIDMKERTIRINKTLNLKTVNKKYIITPPKTKNSIRTCKMCQELYDIIKDYKKTQSCIIGFNNDRFVFGFNKTLSDTTLLRRKKELILRANELIKEYNEEKNASINELIEIRIHDLRHSHASLLINNGANILAVAKRLGDTTETVMKVYAHMFTSTEDELISIMDSKYKK